MHSHARPFGFPARTALIAAATLALASSTQAAFLSWTGAVNPEAFGFVGNWSPAQLPAAADNVIFQNASPSSTGLYLTGGGTVNGMYFQNTNTWLRPNGSNFNAAGSFVVGFSPAGESRVRISPAIAGVPSQIFTNTLTLGGSRELSGSGVGGARGYVTVDGTAQLRTQSALIGNAEGHGERLVANGGYFYNLYTTSLGAQADTFGMLTVSGPTSAASLGSILSTIPTGVTVGDFGEGVLTLDAGGQIDAGTVLAGKNASSRGTITINGAGTLLSARQLLVGQAGTADVSISNGASVVTSQNTVVGPNSTLSLASTIGGESTLNSSSFTLTGSATRDARMILSSGGRATTSGAVQLDAGGVLDLRPGGTMQTTNVIPNGGRVDWNGGSLQWTGTSPLNIAGPKLFGGPMQINNGSGLAAFDAEVTVSAPLSISGVAGVGGLLGSALTVENTGRIDVVNGGIFGRNAIINRGVINAIGSKISATLPGSSITNQGTIYTFASVIQGSVQTTVGSKILVADNLTFTSAVSGAGQFPGPGAVTFNAGYDPGSGVNPIYFSGNVTLAPTNVLRIETTNTLPSASDRLFVAGTVQVGGDLQLVPAPVAIGTSYRIINATSRIGTFAHVLNYEFAPTLWFATTYDATGVTVTAAIPGDANLDRQIDFSDLLALAQHYGQASGQSWPTGDFNYDGATEFTDLLILAQRYGTSAVTDPTGIDSLLTSDFQSDWALAQSLVPEPSLALAVAAMSVTARRRRD